MFSKFIVLHFGSTECLEKRRGEAWLPEATSSKVDRLLLHCSNSSKNWKQMPFNSAGNTNRF